MTNPIESTLAEVRPPIAKTRRWVSRDTILSLASTLGQRAAKRRLERHEQGATFVDGTESKPLKPTATGEPLAQRPIHCGRIYLVTAPCLTQK